MFPLKIILNLIGLIFIGFGYAIWFKGKYNLINNFQRDKKMGRLDDSYAKRVGMIEFIGGIICLVLGILSLTMKDNFILIAFILCITGVVAALILNQVKSTKKLS